MVSHGGALMDTHHGEYRMGHRDHLELTLPKMVFPFPDPTSPAGGHSWSLLGVILC